VAQELALKMRAHQLEQQLEITPTEPVSELPRLSARFIGNR
jgi:hypothetical protein